MNVRKPKKTRRTVKVRCWRRAISVGFGGGLCCLRWTDMCERGEKKEVQKECSKKRNNDIARGSKRMNGKKMKWWTDGCRGESRSK